MTTFGYLGLASPLHDAATIARITATLRRRFDELGGRPLVDPVVGEFRQGDAASGEIEVTPTGAGPTTVLVRRLTSDKWWVLGAASATVAIDERAAFGVITGSTLTVSGESTAAKHEVVVAIHLGDQREPVQQATVARPRPAFPSRSRPRSSGPTSGAAQERSWSPRGMSTTGGSSKQP